jgi:hypothetical protein
MDRFLDEYMYVKTVIRSCVNDRQLDAAKKWAEDWSKRMKYNYPEAVTSWTDLYLNVMEK